MDFYGGSISPIHCYCLHATLELEITSLPSSKSGFLQPLKSCSYCWSKFEDNTNISMKAYPLSYLLSILLDPFIQQQASYVIWASYHASNLLKNFQECINYNIITHTNISISFIFIFSRNRKNHSIHNCISTFRIQNRIHHQDSLSSDMKSERTE